MQQWDKVKIIPIKEILKAIHLLPYGSVHRVMLTMLFLTGCRGSELDNMQKSKLVGDMIYWHKGKNQTGLRKERLPERFIEEIYHYWNNTKTEGDKFFSVCHETFKREFNRDIRPILGKKWLKKETVLFDNLHEEHYVYKLSYLRKDFFSLDNYNNYNEFKSLEIALYMTQKRMGHHSAYMTQIHYLQNFKALELDKYKGKEVAEIYEKEIACQMPLLNWMS